MHITNTQPGPRGINTVNGPVLVDPGQTVDNIEVYEREKAHIEAAGWFTVEGSYTANPPDKDKPAVASVDTSEIDRLKAALAAKDDEIAKLKAPASTEPLKAEHHGGGKFNITQGESVLAQGLSKADADAFNAMTDAEKAEYVAKTKA